MTILANGGRNLNDRGTSKGGNLESVQLGGVTATIQVENLGGKKVIVNKTRSLCSNTSLVSTQMQVNKGKFEGPPTCMIVYLCKE